MMEKLGAPQTHLGLKNMIKEVDEDFDGKLSFREVRDTFSTCQALFIQTNRAAAAHDFKSWKICQLLRSTVTSRPLLLPVRLRSSNKIACGFIPSLKASTHFRNLG